MQAMSDLQFDRFELLGPLEGNSNMLLVENEERLFYLSKATWAVISGLKAEYSREVLTVELQRYFVNRKLNSASAERIIEHTVGQLGAQFVTQKGSPLWGTVTLIGKDRLVKLAGRLPLIPRRIWLFWLLLVIAAAGNLTFLALFPTSRSYLFSLQVAHGALFETAVVVAAMFVIMVVHELAHATAVAKFGLQPAKIGAGFFLVFPALFADVSEIWRLRRRKRIVVNLAGVFAQLWINIAIVCLWAITSDAIRIVLLGVWSVNFISVGINLVPFAKLDGYWVLADCVGQSDLHRAAFSKLAGWLRDPTRMEVELP